MSAQLRRIALITPYAWSVPHPVNDYVAEVTDGLAGLHADDPSQPKPLIIAPSLHPQSRRLTRKALRDLAHGIDADDVLNRPELAMKVGAAKNHVPLLAVGLPIGHASVALRASLRLVYETANIDVIIVQDPLVSDLTRCAIRRWKGLTIGVFHRIPTAGLLATLSTPQRERILDEIDLRAVPHESMRADLANVLGGSEDSIATLPTVAAPDADIVQANRVSGSVVIARAPHDDTLVRNVLRDIAHESADSVTSLVILSRWQKSHRPTVPRALRNITRFVQAKSRNDSDTELSRSAMLITFPDVSRRLHEESNAFGLNVAVVDETTPPITIPFVDSNARALSLPTRREIAAPLTTAANRIIDRRHTSTIAPAAREKTCMIDLHMHTSHSWDCATDPEALLFAAREVGLSAIAVTDHNEISGALVCADLAEEYGIQVIVGEEIKTSQGEVIGLFLNERIEPGLPWHETIARIRQQDGLVYVPHPFDRLHTIPDSHTLRESLDEIDAFEVYNARLTFPQYNRDALRFARKYNLIEGAGSDAHVSQGLGSAAVHMPAWDDPESFLIALRQGEIVRNRKSLVMLQGRKFIHTMTGKTKRTPQGT